MFEEEVFESLLSAFEVECVTGMRLSLHFTSAVRLEVSLLELPPPPIGSSVGPVLTFVGNPRRKLRYATASLDETRTFPLRLICNR